MTDRIIREREKAMHYLGCWWSGKAGSRLFVGFLMVSVALVLGWSEVSANERTGMPSERQALEERYAGTGAGTDAVARVQSLRRHEDRLFVNGEPYILKSTTRFEDEDGFQIGLEDIPLGAQIEVEYRTGSGLEESGYDPGTKILTKIRIVQAPHK